MAVQDDRNVSNNIADLFWVGSLTGQTSGGLLNSSAATNNGTVNVQPLVVTGYDPSIPYTGASKTNIPGYTTPLLGSPRTFNSGERIVDPSGEFIILDLRSSFNSPVYDYSLLGFLGTPTLSVNMPSSGINHYSGPTAGFLSGISPTTFETIGNSFELSANWHNGKVIGAIAKPDDVYFTPALPKTRSGKIMRRLLKELVATGKATGNMTTLEDINVVKNLEKLVNKK